MKNKNSGIDLYWSKDLIVVYKIYSEIVYINFVALHMYMVIELLTTNSQVAIQSSYDNQWRHQREALIV